MTSTTIENVPTYKWTAAVGAVSSIIGLIAMVVCIYASVSQSTEAGFAPIPNGVTALACAMTLGGLVLILFRILHADRDEMMRRLEELDSKLNNVWGIAATSSIETKPFHPQTEKAAQQHTQRRGRRRGKSGGEVAGDNVVPMLSPETKRAARGLAARFVRDQQKRSEDRTEDN